MLKISMCDNETFDILVDDTLVGSGTFVPTESDTDFCYLERIDIIAQHQNQGFGTQALLSLKNIFGSYYLSPDNPDAQRLYGRLGYKISSTDYDRFGFAIDNGFGVYAI